MAVTGKKENYWMQFLIPAVIILLLIFFIVKAPSAMLPLVLSVALAYILNPLIEYFTVRGVKRVYAVAGFYLVVGGVLCALGIIIFNILAPELSNFPDTWPAYVSKAQAYFADFNARLSEHYPFLLSVHLEDRVISWLSMLPQYIVNIFPALSLLFLVPFVTFFVLLGGTDVIDYILDHIPSGKVELLLHIMSRIDSSLGSYLRGIMTEAFLLSLIALLGLLLLNINYAVIIAMIIGLSSIIPYIGAFVGAFLAAVVSYLQYGTFVSVFKVLLLFVCIRFFDDWFLQPYIMKRAVELNPAVIVIVLMAGWEIGGIIGVIFSIPVACIIKEILSISIEIQESEFHWKPKNVPAEERIPYI